MNSVFRRIAGFGSLVALGAVIGTAVTAAQQQVHIGYKDTPMLPGGKWHVHDSDRPQPKVIDPGTPSTQEVPGKAPSDAVVLFDGTNMDHWRNGNSPCKWKLENGYMEVKPGSGSISTTDQIG